MASGVSHKTLVHLQGHCLTSSSGCGSSSASSTSTSCSISTSTSSSTSTSTSSSDDGGSSWSNSASSRRGRDGGSGLCVRTFAVPGCVQLFAFVTAVPIRGPAPGSRDFALSAKALMSALPSTEHLEGVRCDCLQQQHEEEPAAGRVVLCGMSPACLSSSSSSSSSSSEPPASASLCLPGGPAPGVTLHVNAPHDLLVRVLMLGSYGRKVVDLEVELQQGLQDIM